MMGVVVVDHRRLTDDAPLPPLPTPMGSNRIPRPLLPNHILTNRSSSSLLFKPSGSAPASLPGVLISLRSSSSRSPPRGSDRVVDAHRPDSWSLSWKSVVGVTESGSSVSDFELCFGTVGVFRRTSKDGSKAVGRGEEGCPCVGEESVMNVFDLIGVVGGTTEGRSGWGGVVGVRMAAAVG